MRAVVRVVLALLPLCLAPAFGYLLSDGSLNFGGGEKDILLMIPWAFWSLIYGISSFVLWYRRRTVGRAALLSIAFATAGTIVAGLVLAFVGLLGIGGRF